MFTIECEVVNFESLVNKIQRRSPNKSLYGVFSLILTEAHTNQI